MKLHKTFGVGCLVILATVLPVPARASMFGEENVILGGILAQAVKESAQFGAALATMKETLDLARKGARLTNDAVQIARNITLIAEDPEGYLRANSLQFVHAFEGTAGLAQDIAAIRESARGQSRRYNPYAFASALESAKQTSGAAFHLAIRFVDQWGINDVHDKILEDLVEQEQSATKILSDVAKRSLIGEMTPQAASIYASQSAAITATANTRSAIFLEQLIRIEKMRFMEDVNAAAHMAAETKRSGADELLNSTHSWRLPISQGRGL